MLRKSSVYPPLVGARGINPIQNRFCVCIIHRVADAQMNVLVMRPEQIPGAGLAAHLPLFSNVLVPTDFSRPADNVISVLKTLEGLEMSNSCMLSTVRRLNQRLMNISQMLRPDLQHFKRTLPCRYCGKSSCPRRRSNGDDPVRCGRSECVPDRDECADNGGQPDQFGEHGIEKSHHHRKDREEFRVFFCQTKFYQSVP